MAEPTPCSACFTYGSLMWADIMARVCGRPWGDRAAHEVFDSDVAELFGHERRAIRGQDYPGLVPLEGQGPPGIAVRGVLYRGLSPQEFARLDAFEGVEYERVLVRVHLLEPAAAGTGGPAERVTGLPVSTMAEATADRAPTVPAWVYRFRAAFVDRLLALPWDPVRFEREGKSRFMQRHMDIPSGTAT